MTLHKQIITCWSFEKKLQGHHYANDKELQNAVCSGYRVGTATFTGRECMLLFKDGDYAEK
jgi:hypothetical protein